VYLPVVAQPGQQNHLWTFACRDSPSRRARRPGIYATAYGIRVVAGHWIYLERGALERQANELSRVDFAVNSLSRLAPFIYFTGL
jgi:hypothetical protein